ASCERCSGPRRGGAPPVSWSDTHSPSPPPTCGGLPRPVAGGPAETSPVLAPCLAGLPHGGGRHHLPSRQATAHRHPLRPPNPLPRRVSTVDPRPAGQPPWGTGKVGPH